MGKLRHHSLSQVVQVELQHPIVQSRNDPRRQDYLMTFCNRSKCPFSAVEASGSKGIAFRFVSWVIKYRQQKVLQGALPVPSDSRPPPDFLVLGPRFIFPSQPEPASPLPAPRHLTWQTPSGHTKSDPGGAGCSPARWPHSLCCRWQPPTIPPARLCHRLPRPGRTGAAATAVHTGRHPASQLCLRLSTNL